MKGLNKKIDLISTAVIDRDRQPDDQQKTHISLSEGGLSFSSEAQYHEGSHLAMQVTLLPSHHQLILFGKVMNCSHVPNGYSVAASFVKLKDSDRQMIAKHIMQLQLIQRRRQGQDDELH